jgi:hypothetical protein
MNKTVKNISLLLGAVIIIWFILSWVAGLSERCRNLYNKPLYDHFLCEPYFITPRVVLSSLEYVADTRFGWYAPWSYATELIDSCEVRSFELYHSKKVYLHLKDGRKIRTIEPGINDLFPILKQAEPRCGKIDGAIE